jgi:chemotaxis protein MotB
VPLDPQDPDKAVNRRISIVVMNKKTELAISKDSGAIEAENKPDTQEGISDAVNKP